jgi:hypothetical protein
VASASTPKALAGAFSSHCSARVPGLNHSSESLPSHPVRASISSREPSAVTTRLSVLSVPGTFTGVTEPFAACLLNSSVPQAPTDCRYSPDVSRQASMSPKSGPDGLRCGVSATGLAPLAGTSQRRAMADDFAKHSARMVPALHHRTGVHPGSFQG